MNNHYRLDSNVVISKKDSFCFLINPFRQIYLVADEDMYNFLTVSSISDEQVHEFCRTHECSRSEILNLLIDNYIITSDDLLKADSIVEEEKYIDVVLVLDCVNETLIPEKFDHILEELASLSSESNFINSVEVRGLCCFSEIIQEHILEHLLQLTRNINLIYHKKCLDKIKTSEKTKEIYSMVKFVTIKFDAHADFDVHKDSDEEDDDMSTLIENVSNIPVPVQWDFVNEFPLSENHDNLASVAALFNMYATFLYDVKDVWNYSDVDIFEGHQTLLTLFDDENNGDHFFEHLKKWPVKEPDYNCPNNKKTLVSDNQSYYVQNNKKLNCTNCKYKKDICMDCEISFLCKMKCRCNFASDHCEIKELIWNYIKEH